MEPGLTPAAARGTDSPREARARLSADPPPARGGGVQAVERAIHLLEVLAERDAPGFRS